MAGTDQKAVPRKRGRKTTGNAKSGAQRMEETRARDRAALNRAVYPSDYAALSTRVLLEGLSDAVQKKYQKVARKISTELVRRANPDFDDQPKVVENNQSSKGEG